MLAAATADNTRRAYRSAVNHYLAWGGVLPADEVATIRYLLAYAATLNPRTLAAPDRVVAVARPPGIPLSYVDADGAQDPDRDRAHARPPKEEGQGAADRGLGADRGAAGQPRHAEG